jgi:inner membrane protein
MDTVTQALLGSTVGQAAFGRRLGGKALLWGAVGGALPDLDTFVVAPFGEFATMVHHRGLTHSLWFGPVVGTALGYAIWRRRRHRPDASQERLLDWVGLWVLAIGTHPLLDLFTTYGTQLLTPFSNHRFAINGIGIIDPAYTLLLLLAVIMGIAALRRPAVGKWASWTALGLTTSYLFYGLHLNHVAERLARNQLRASGIEQAEVRAYPTVLQLWLRRVVATNADTIRVGYVSTLAPATIQWFAAPRTEHPLVTRLAESPKGRLFAWFAQDMLAGHVRPSPEGVVVELDDIRYGLPPRADHGFWGIRATFSESGEQLTPVERFRRPMPGATSQALGALWRAARGYEPCTFRVGIAAGAAPTSC